MRLGRRLFRQAACLALPLRAIRAALSGKTNGTGTRYFDHRGVALAPYYGTSNITLYAYWVQTQFNVTLNAQGGSGGAASVITTGTDGALPAPGNVRPPETQLPLSPRGRRLAPAG